MNFVWRTDVHLSDKAPSSRVDDWAATVFGKLSQTKELARRCKAVAVLDGGDFFHIKSPTRNSHALVSRAINHHADYPCPVYCTPGNHDSVYGDYAFLPQQPLGVLFSSGAYQRLYDEHEAIFEEKVGDRVIKVRVVGIPYHGTTYDMERFRGLERGDEDYLICVAHVLASCRGGKMFEGEDIVKYEDLLGTAPDVYLFGHWHKDQGIEELEDERGSKFFVNIGSLTRGSLSQDEVERKPAMALISCTKDGITIDAHRLKVDPPSEVFDMEGRARQVKRQVEMDSFVTKIRDSLLPVDGETLQSSIESMDVPSEVREKALAYLEQAVEL
jgi:DNA repair exonuclease SbcCD nuclease subunit